MVLSWFSFSKKCFEIFWGNWGIRVLFILRFVESFTRKDELTLSTFYTYFLFFYSYFYIRFLSFHTFSHVVRVVRSLEARCFDETTF